MAEKASSTHACLEQDMAEYAKDLKKERDFLDSILRSLHDVVIVLDKKGRIKLCSPNVERMFGYSLDEIKEIKTFIQNVFPDSMDAAEVERHLQENNQPFFVEKAIPFVRKDGSSGWMRLHILSGTDGEHIVLNMRDITERQRVETEAARARSELDQIFQSAGDGMRVVDRDFNVLRMNDAFLHLCGLSREEASNRKCFEVFPGPWCHTPGCSLSKIISGERLVDSEVCKKREDGASIYCHVVASAYRDSEGRAIGMIQTFSDLSKLKQVQSQLLQSEKMASIGQLAAGVAHEINNPVGFINSNLTTLDEYRRDLTALLNSFMELEQLAAGNPAPAGEQDLAGTLETVRNLKEKMDIDFVLGDFDKVIAESMEGTDRIKKIVQALKDFSHVDQAELTWANLNKGLESTLNIVWNEIKYKATVKKDYGDIPEVYCYPQQINQVFMNILVNAAHAIEDKGEIKISTAYIDGAEPMVEIRISDTGKGIPPENLPKIFDPFFTTKPVGKGTGLGLSMAYSIIKKHDGEIKVESEVGKGTTFVIELPVNGSRTKEGDTSDTG
jgi:PAS domain S-box-containing protein